MKKILVIIFIFTYLFPGTVTVLAEAGDASGHYCKVSKGPCKHGDKCSSKHKGHKKIVDSTHVSEWDKATKPKHKSTDKHNHHKKAQSELVADSESGRLVVKVQCHSDYDTGLGQTPHSTMLTLVSNSFKTYDLSSSSYEKEKRSFYENPCRNIPLRPPLLLS